MIGIQEEKSNKKRSIGFCTFSTITDLLQYRGILSISVLHSSSSRFRNIVDRLAMLRFPFSQDGLLYASEKLSHNHFQRVSSKTTILTQNIGCKRLSFTFNRSLRSQATYLLFCNVQSYPYVFFVTMFQAICFFLSQYVAHRKCGYSLCGQSYSSIKYETPKIAPISHHQLVHLLVHLSLHLSHCVSLCSSN